MSHFKRPESVLVVVHNGNGQVLRLRRNDPPGFWQSVTGSLLEGEAPAAAAHRELLEETGIDAWPEATGVTNTYAIRPEWRHRYAPEVTHNVEHVFTVQVPADTKVQRNPGEHAEYRWLDIDAAMELSSSPTDAEAVRQLALKNQFGGV